MFGRSNRDIIQKMNSRRMNFLIFISYLVLGGYFINKQFNFLAIPEKILQFENWIIFVGGFFLLLGAMHYYKASK